jgi:hypothetical protein
MGGPLITGHRDSRYATPAEPLPMCESPITEMPIRERARVKGNVCEFILINIKEKIFTTQHKIAVC